MDEHKDINGKLADATLNGSIGALGGLVIGLFTDPLISKGLKVPIETALIPLIGIVFGVIIGIMVSVRKNNRRSTS